MARIIWTGFELADLDLEVDARHELSDHSAVVKGSANYWGLATPGAPRSGDYFAGCLSGAGASQNDILGWVIPTATDELYFRFALSITEFKIDTEDNPVFCAFLDSTGAVQIRLTYNPVTQKIVAIRGGTATSYLGHDNGGTAIATGTHTLQQLEWILITGYLKVHDTSGVLQIKVDGDTGYDINFSGDTQGQSGSNVDVFRLGIELTATNIAHHFDDVAVNDTVGSYENSWPLSGGIYYLPADGDGGDDDWTPSTGSVNWEMVDEIPSDDNTTYNEADTAGDKDLYTVEDLPDETDTVTMVAPLAIAALEAAGSESLDVIYHNGTAERTAETETLVDNEYKLIKSDPIYVDPDTSAKWLKATVDGMKVGVEL